MERKPAYITRMRDPANVLEIEDLHTCFFTDAGPVRSVSGVSFDVPAGSVVGVVGESGCGKSVTSLSVMGLLQRPHGKVTGGQIRLNLGGEAWDLAKTPEKKLRSLRGGVMSMIFQEPMTALNPVLTIGKQLEEAIFLHGRPGEKHRAAALLERVGIGDSERVCKLYPHNLSGGMRQRVMIAMALAGDPRLIIADEPTTALDVTVQAQILELLQEIQKQLGSAIMLITHDLGVVAEMAQQVVVMYAGRVVETGTVREIFHHPAHPYTLGLMASKPVVGNRKDRLYAISGTVPDPLKLPKGCYFYQRCDRASEDCHGEYPCMIRLSPTHTVSCWRSQEAENG